MAGTRTAPTIDGTPTYWNVQLRWVDAAGDLRSDLYRITIATDALIETFVAAMQSASNACLYQVEPRAVYASIPQKSNADEAVWNSKDANIVMQMGEAATQRKFDIFVPAPEETNFVDDTEQPDPASAELAAITTAMAALQLLVYVPISYRFTERRDKNPRVLVG